MRVLLKSTGGLEMGALGGVMRVTRVSFSARRKERASRRGPMCVGEKEQVLI
jgi:hypothetical protein